MLLSYHVPINLYALLFIHPYRYIGHVTTHFLIIQRTIDDFFLNIYRTHAFYPHDIHLRNGDHPAVRTHLTHTCFLVFIILDIIFYLSKCMILLHQSNFFPFSIIFRSIRVIIYTSSIFLPYA